MEYHIPTYEELIELCVSGAPLEILQEPGPIKVKGYFTYYFSIYNNIEKSNEIWGLFKHYNMNYRTHFRLDKWGEHSGQDKIRHLSDTSGLLYGESEAKNAEKRRALVPLVFEATKIAINPELDWRVLDLINKEIIRIEPDIRKLLEEIAYYERNLVLVSRIICTFLRDGAPYTVATKLWQDLAQTNFIPFYLTSKAQWNFMIFNLIDAGILTNPLNKSDEVKGIWGAFRDTSDEFMDTYKTNTYLSVTDYQKLIKLRKSCMKKIPSQMLRELNEYGFVHMSKL